MRSEDIAWAAGLFEGEGWWGPRAKTSAEAVLGSTDRDVVERFASIVGASVHIHAEDRSKKGHKTLYRCDISSAEKVRALIDLFWPYLGDRRRADARKLLAFTADCPGRGRAGMRHSRRTPRYQSEGDA